LSLRHLDDRREDEEQRSANRCDRTEKEVAAVVWLDACRDENQDIENSDFAGHHLWYEEVEYH
jgi:hypothetical protein